ncbi:MAG: hypothetical protein KU37_06855 [Sulfuricurvum sp. PC08-66]|nr:MAG: hypothetical protein KU37_06855 [Sulfuricurvum sp. PC08-66]
MLVVTTPDIAHARIVQTLGVVRGSTIQSRHIGKDILAFLKMLIGGEIRNYTQMMAQAREESMQRMVDMAQAMGANAVVNMRFTSVAVMSTAAESLAYGTAVIIEEV